MIIRARRFVDSLNYSKTTISVGSIIITYVIGENFNVI